MATPQQDVENLEAALAAMAERAAADPDYREQLIADHVGALAAAGVSALSLTESLVEADATAADVEAFGMGPTSFGDISGGGGPQELRLTNWCVGTCRKQTIWICSGCSNSFLANPSGPNP